MDIKAMIDELHNIFDKINKDIFDNELQKPVILIQQNKKKKDLALGWITVKEVWLNQDESDKRKELTIASEYLLRPIEEIAETMMHEMVHLYNSQNDIKDCSRGGSYHNKRFKEQAEAFGLTVEKSDKYGYAHTKLSDWLLEKIKGYNFNQSVFNAARMMPSAGSKKQTKKSKKFICPRCGQSFRSTKELDIVCGKCNENFEIEDSN